MDDNDLRALLGDAYADTTPEQRAAITRAASAIDDRWPLTVTDDGDLDDHPDERRDALSAAMEVILGDSVDGEIAAEWHAARAVERTAHARLTGAIIAGALVSPAESEHARAARLQVTRMTLRKALGR